MKLYKFRSLRSNFEFVLDILLNERLYCANYRNLNDPLEGMFSATQPGRAPVGLRFTEIPHFVEDLPRRSEETRVCSLSRPLTEMLLWSHYGDEHRGVAIEIDFTGANEPLPRPVTYVDRIPGVPLTILGSPTAVEVLLNEDATLAIRTGVSDRPARRLLPNSRHAFLCICGI